MIDIRQLNYFIELVKTSSFTNAAQNMDVTQPTLTRVLKELEDELHTTLIERNSKSFVVTDTGRALYEDAQKLIQNVETIKSRINDIQHSKSGEVRLAVPSVLLPLYFVPLLVQFRQLFPNIKITVSELASKSVLSSLMDEKTDIGFMMMPLRHPNLACTAVVSDFCSAVVHKSSILALQECLDIRQLANKKIATFTRDATLHSLFIEYCHDAGFEPNITYKSMNCEFLMDMIKLTDCVGIFPAPVLRHYLLPDLVEIPLKPDIPWTIIIGYNKNSYISHSCKYFLDFALEYFGHLNRKRSLEDWPSYMHGTE